jgi:hypothetical protein
VSVIPLVVVSREAAGGETLETADARTRTAVRGRHRARVARRASARTSAINHHAMIRLTSRPRASRLARRRVASSVAFARRSHREGKEDC